MQATTKGILATVCNFTRSYMLSRKGISYPHLKYSWLHTVSYKEHLAAHRCTHRENPQGCGLLLGCESSPLVVEHWGLNSQTQCNLVVRAERKSRPPLNPQTATCQRSWTSHSELTPTLMSDGEWKVCALVTWILTGHKCQDTVALEDTIEFNHTSQLQNHRNLKTMERHGPGHELEHCSEHFRRVFHLFLH